MRNALFCSCGTRSHWLLSCSLAPRMYPCFVSFSLVMAQHLHVNAIHPLLGIGISKRVFFACSPLVINDNSTAHPLFNIIYLNHMPRAEDLDIYSLAAVVSSSSPARAFLLVWIRSCLLSRAALVLARLASISSFNARSRWASALALWIC